MSIMVRCNTLNAVIFTVSVDICALTALEKKDPIVIQIFNILIGPSDHLMINLVYSILKIFDIPINIVSA